jgi:hypothetical protein
MDRESPSCPDRITSARPTPPAKPTSTRNLDSALGSALALVFVLVSVFALLAWVYQAASFKR